MADIKTRQVNKGSIKTIDHAGSMARRIKSASIRAKENMIDSRRSDESHGSSSSFAMEKMAIGGRSAARISTAGSRRAVERAKREYASRRIRKESEERKIAAEREGAGDGVERAGTAELGIAQNRKTAPKTAKPVNTVPTKHLEQGARSLQAKKTLAEKQRLYARTQAARAKRKKAAERSAKMLKATIEGVRSSLIAIGTGGISAILIVVMLVFFGIGAMTFSSNSADDVPTGEMGEEMEYFIPDLSGSGSRYAIVKAAAKEVGNVGGRKFWKWFGFNEHVHWCACFTSYIAEECGYIKSGLCPKSAVVSGWISFYKKQGRWAGRNYTPHSGDFIIFDWEGDGEADHIGIVESCDGKTVRTIEGNSGDVCRRQAYSKGSSVIVGYCIPNYMDL